MTQHYIAIAGNIGVGKSTLTKLLSQRLGWEPFYEAVSENPYLADFYQDMTRYAFHSQVFFLSRRLQQHRQLLDVPGPTVHDRTVYEDAEIFAQALYHQEHITPRDFKTYRDLYETIIRFLPPPDLVVYLRASTETLLRRIALRGRSFEQNISADYLERLNVLYESWMQAFALCPVLTVPADKLDFVRNDAHLDLIVRKIEEKLSGKEEVVFP